MLASIPDSIQRRVAELLAEKVGSKVVLENFFSASGGCINNGGRLEASTGTFFIKWNDSGKYPNMFKLERKGLELLEATKTVNVPRVMLAADVGRWQFLLIEFIEEDSRHSKYWEELGRQLAQLHRCSNSHFGLEHDNFIGSLPQRNMSEISWSAFFIEHRLQPMVSLLRSSGRVDDSFVSAIEKLYLKLENIMPAEAPSLLHGDLWSGNVLTGRRGVPVVIDPAVYYGHREAELAFTRLFGGFDGAFYRAYFESFPVAPAFEQRYELYNLYPLLVHANLFGDSYLMDVRSIIKRFL